MDPKLIERFARCFGLRADDMSLKLNEDHSLNVSYIVKVGELSRTLTGCNIDPSLPPLINLEELQKLLRRAEAAESELIAQLNPCEAD